MVSFRRCILALAVLALFTGLASAQVAIGPIGTSSAGPLQCGVVNTGGPTQVRAEGYAELLGDIVIQCTGGSQTQGVQLANFTVALNNTFVTSRVFSNGLSEALLLIDEPGAGAQFAPGGVNPQNQCGAFTQGAGPGGCAVIAGNAGAYYGAVTSGTSPIAINVFQGIVSGNQVIFNGIPIVAPVTSGYARVFRITNLRGNANQFAGQAGNFQGQIPILASVSISSGPVVTNPVQTVGFLFNGLSTTVRNAGNSSGGTSISNILQCGTAGLTQGAVLRFTEGFAAAFKTRVAPTANYSGAITNSAGPVQASTVVQNLPAQVLPGSESGFVLGVSGSNTAGLADFGTRLKATFNNVPTGVNLFVTVTNVNPAGNTGVAANGSVTANVQNLAAGTVQNQSIAALVLTEGSTSAAGGFLPLQAGNANGSSTGSLFGPLAVDANGTATAVWEVLATQPTASESLEFGLYYSYAGNPAQNIPPTTPAGTVSLSFAPTFSAYNSSNLIPRFAPAQTTTTIVSVALCQTTLLYPWVTSEPGFDTGIAIANTSADPFGTRSQSGTCTLNFFGSGAGTTTTATTPTIAAGTVYADQVSNLRPGFRGYVIAVCNFQLAHGYALFSDTGIRNWATGYLALVLPRGTSNRNSENLNYSPTTAVEGLGN